MIRITEKIGHRKMVAAMLLIGIAVFSVVYALFQTKSGFAVLTSPPPGIPGPYYVTAEAKIYGPVVDLAAIKSKMGGTYASDYTYVQWGTNPFYRAHLDNTLQEVYYGTLVDIMNQFTCGNYYNAQLALESNLNITYAGLVNLGAVDPSSQLGRPLFFGNVEGSFLVLYFSGVQGSVFADITASSWKAALVGVSLPWVGTHVWVSLNGSSVDLPIITEYTSLNSVGGSGGMMNWNVTYRSDWSMGGAPVAVTVFVTIYLTSFSSIETQTTFKNYTFLDSPSTSFVSKHITPASPVAGASLSIVDRFDPPAANKVNLTDSFPNVFGWTSSQVTLEKHRVGVGLVASASLSVTPTPDGSNMKISINYDQSPTILQSLLSDEYIHMSYTLTAPTTSGEYTLPSATMSYLIPLPQTG